jgi:hypothetical protein
MLPTRWAPSTAIDLANESSHHLGLHPQTLRFAGADAGFTECSTAARMLWGHMTQPRDEAFNREMVVCHFLGLMQGLYRLRYSGKY